MSTTATRTMTEAASKARSNGRRACAPDLLSCDDVAFILDVPVATIEEWFRKGLLANHHGGVSPSTLRDFMQRMPTEIRGMPKERALALVDILVGVKYQETTRVEIITIQADDD